jgi:hypothetical protein
MNVLVYFAAAISEVGVISKDDPLIRWRMFRITKVEEEKYSVF